MAENDIYNNQRIYENLLGSLDKFCQKPAPGESRKYWIKNPLNMEYFLALKRDFEAKDLSFVRRNRLFQTLRMITNATDKDLKDCTREDINQITAFMHTKYSTIKSKHDFVRDLKRMWKTLFPVLDEKGQIDENQVPYVVRHLKQEIDISKEKLKKDKLTLAEFERILTYFAKDPRIQAYLMLAMESLGRPQELLYLKIGDIEEHDNYAKVWISEHGKEGVGFLQCIDAWPNLMRWLRVHPLAGDPQAFLFVTLDGRTKHHQLKPFNINKKLREACEKLRIPRRITCYSMKRNGVTFRRLNGETDMEIQHAARWTSTKQLRTYDMSEADEAMKIRLAKKGKIKEKIGQSDFSTRKCVFCGMENGFNEQFCSKCLRPLDREKIAQIEHLREEGVFKAFMNLPEVKQLFQRFYKLDDRLKRLEKVKKEA